MFCGNGTGNERLVIEIAHNFVYGLLLIIDNFLPFFFAAAHDDGEVLGPAPIGPGMNTRKKAPERNNSIGSTNASVALERKKFYGKNQDVCGFPLIVAQTEIGRKEVLHHCVGERKFIYRALLLGKKRDFVLLFC